MKYFVIPSAAVSSNSFTFHSKCRFGFSRALMTGVFAALALLSVDIYVAAATVSSSNSLLGWSSVGTLGGLKSATLTNNSASSITIKEYRSWRFESYRLFDFG